MKRVSLLLGASLSACSFAQLGYSGGVLADNLNQLPTASSFTFLDNWQDNSTLAGWYRTVISDGTPGVENRFRVDDGGATGGSVWSLGTFGSSDRALGFTTSSNLVTIHIGVRLVNLTSTVLTQADISYFGEQWRTGVAGRNEMRLSYQIGAASLTTGTWTARTDLDFISIQEAGGPIALNGNLAENRRQIQGTLTGLNWNPGESLWIRWTGSDRPGADHTLAVDDFAVQAVPEPMTLSAFGLAFLLFRRRQC
jgi:hypothetical protein